MDKHFIVCKYTPAILKYLSNKSVVFHISSLSQLEELKKNCADHKIHIHCIVYKTTKYLSDIKFSEEWMDLPIAVNTVAIGKLNILLRIAPILKKLNIRFYFSTSNKNCYSDIRILASLGYCCTLKIDGTTADWDAITELMTYSILNVVKHAEIYPFEYVSHYYDPLIKTDFSAVYFEDPERYLHLTNDKKLTLIPQVNGEDDTYCFDLKDFDNITKKKEYLDFKYKWQEFFIKPTPCGCCKGWRICLGKYAKYIESNPGCSDFFGEFLDILDIQKQNDKITKPDDKIWQP